jgi:hypothetical protein
LKEAAAMVRPTGPEALTPPLLSAIPTPGPALASTILFFLSALKGGDLRGWLGDAATTLLEEIQDGRLSSRLSDDFAQLGRLASHPQPSAWQVMLIPIARDDNVEQLRLFYRHKPGQGEREADAAGRFIVEAELKRFGVVQLDGLVKPKQFDLALRTDVPLTPDMQNDIRGIFGSALEIGGSSGTMRFETPSTASVDPFHQEAGDGSHGSDVIV